MVFRSARGLRLALRSTLSTPSPSCRQHLVGWKPLSSSLPHISLVYEVSDCIYLVDLVVTSRPRFSSTVAFSPVKPPRSVSRLSLIATGLALTALGFIMTAGTSIEAASQLLGPITDAESLELYEPTSDFEREVEKTINSHHLVQELRNNPDFNESRPHLKIPPAFRPHNLTGGTLLGPGRVAVPPFAWSEKEGKSFLSISYLGEDLCGHPGIVHGGFLATMLDEGLARCCFPALPHNVGMTANLNINYRSPAKAGSYVVLKATTTKVEGRKAWVEGRLETLVGEGETPTLIADATALFISPRQAATMKRVYPVG